jgi:hypothetical protein
MFGLATFRRARRFFSSVEGLFWRVVSFIDGLILKL